MGASLGVIITLAVLARNQSIAPHGERLVECIIGHGDKVVEHLIGRGERLVVCSDKLGTND